MGGGDGQAGQPGDLGQRVLAALGERHQDRSDLAGDRSAGFGGVACHGAAPPDVDRVDLRVTAQENTAATPGYQRVIPKTTSAIRIVQWFPGWHRETPGASSGRTRQCPGRISGWSWTGWRPSSRSSDRGGFTAASEHGPPLPVPGQRAHRRAGARARRTPDRPHPPPRPPDPGGRGVRPARPGDRRRASAPRAPRSARSAGMDAEPLTVLTTPVHRRRALPRRPGRGWRRPHPGRAGRRWSSSAGHRRRAAAARPTAPSLAVLPRVATRCRRACRSSCCGGSRSRPWCPPATSWIAPETPVPLDALVRLDRWSSAARTPRRPERLAPEVLDQLMARGRVVQPRAVVDTPQTLIALVRAGVGVGVVNAVALGPLDLVRPRRARHRRPDGAPGRRRVLVRRARGHAAWAWSCSAPSSTRRRRPARHPPEE